MPKIINDPVHGFIAIQDELIYRLVSHPYFQRLRRIKQMALAYLVYPGAVHTRLHHCLGAYHLMCMALQELRAKGVDINDEEALGAKVAILLHDIGHGPFSHALEHSLVDVHHESISLLIMERLDQEFGGALRTGIEIFTGRYPKKYLHQLVSSQLDVDRLDYLARDSFFTGVSEGVIGYDRILKMLAVHQDNLVVEEKGIHSAENFLIARRLMYLQVYLHKTVLSSELMLVNILQRARTLCGQGADLFGTPSLRFFLQHKANEDDFKSDARFLNHFLMLDDSDINSAIKVWSTSSDGILSDLCSKLLARQLFKVEFSENQPVKRIQEIREELLQQDGFTEEMLPYYLIAESSLNLTYRLENEGIGILLKNGTVVDISELEYSLIHAGVLVPVKKHYICYLKKTELPKGL